MLVHDFLLVKEVPQQIWYRDFPKDSMLCISDDFILSNWEKFSAVEMYWNYWGNTQLGLAYDAISIMTPQMANSLSDSLDGIDSKSEECRLLISLLKEATKNKLNVIHFGI